MAAPQYLDEDLPAAVLAEVVLVIGVPKETKNHEGRAGLVPATVRELVVQGHRVLVQKDAGRGADLFNENYTRAGATLANDGKIAHSAVAEVSGRELPATDFAIAG